MAPVPSTESTVNAYPPLSHAHGALQTRTHFAAIFRGGDDAYLQVVQLTEFDYTQATLSGTFLDSLKAASTENHDIYDVAGRCGVEPFCDHSDAQPFVFVHAECHIGVSQEVIL